ncbi:MAG TPA: GNAT family N-acetyltransferase [Ktedonobacteraceae bacterium]|jgi:ribosomal protein S18 acetylase RimI-like enzyme
MLRQAEQMRPLSLGDLPAITRLLRTSDYVYQRFTLEELKHLLRSYPAVGLWHGNSLHSFLLSQTLNPPVAWIGGFGVNWSESRSALRFLDLQMELLAGHLRAREIHFLHYSGNDQENDWLRGPLLERGFTPFRLLYAYDKLDYRIPAPGNPQVILRRAEPRDIPELLTLEALCFEQIWRYDSASFADMMLTHPYFMVAQLHGRVVGYQFNALDGVHGYLVRIAVHPACGGQGIGVRLMAEAMRFFQHAHVTRIMLNTQQENTHAHRLYEWFGFSRLGQIGFILRRPL